jgi:hypothetical protein
MHVEEMQRAIEEKEHEIAVLAIGASSPLVMDLVRLTRREPEFHLGHLDARQFEAVRALLQVPMDQVGRSDHGNGDRFIKLSVVRDGLRIVAQAYAPPPAVSDEVSP